MRTSTAVLLLALAVSCPWSRGQEPPPPPPPSTMPATTQAAGKLPFIDVDVNRRQVHVACEFIDCKAPLEFFCCVSGTNEHEAVLRSKVKPSHLHLALLMIGLEPGQGVHYDPASQKLVPPTGAALDISCRFEKNGKTQTLPAAAFLRDVKSKRPAPPLRWIFAGSRVINGSYAGDQTGYLVSVVNFELTVVDVGAIASSANETLEWEVNPDAALPRGTTVTMILQPAGPPK